MRQDEYLFNQNAICAIFRAIYSKIQCNLVLNAVQYAAKRKAKSINIHYNCINKTFLNHETDGQKGQNGHLKVGF